MADSSDSDSSAILTAKQRVIRTKQRTSTQQAARGLDALASQSLGTFFPPLAVNVGLLKSPIVTKRGHTTTEMSRKSRADTDSDPESEDEFAGAAVSAPQVFWLAATFQSVFHSDTTMMIVIFRNYLVSLQVVRPVRSHLWVSVAQWAKPQRFELRTNPHGRAYLSKIESQC